MCYICGGGVKWTQNDFDVRTQNNFDSATLNNFDLRTQNHFYLRSQNNFLIKISIQKYRIIKILGAENYFFFLAQGLKIIDFKIQNINLSNMFYVRWLQVQEPVVSFLFKLIS